MRGTVAKTFLFPVKGMAGIPTPSRGIMAHTRHGVVGDRCYAVYRKKGDPPTEWKLKGQFHVCMNTEGAGLDHGISEEVLDERFMLNRAFVGGLVDGSSCFPETSHLVESRGQWLLTDTNKPYVSFLNLASVRELEKFLGVPVDPRRFRMNVWVEGVPAFAELEYVQSFGEGVKYPMQVHGVQLHIDDIAERCQAIEQNPATGKWDLALREGIAQLMQRRGYKGSPHRGKLEVMGWLAIPQNIDLIREGHTVFLG